ncbi:MAG: sugar phosphate nucleotidyltransferase [Planctomycetota bacterium]
MSSVHAVILAGGSGTRFWPASRAARPKQFLPLAGGKPLIEATLDRLQGLVPDDHVWVATNKQQAKGLAKLLPNLRRERLILEPEARDTAPCVALAAATIGARDPDATMIVLPADHVIEPRPAFQAMLRAGIAAAQDGETLVTFGITPTSPATGFGWLECGAPVGANGVRRVVRFREKPDRATAERFVAAGNFLWNSGIFVWRLPALRAAMERSDPELAGAAAAMLAALQKPEGTVKRSTFQQAPARSIDYAVMEKADKVVVVPATVRWNDVGSFPALAAEQAPDGDGNVAVLANGAAGLALQAHDNIVYAEGNRTVALFGVRDLVVVAVGDAVLVCSKDKANDLKTLVQHVRAQGRTDLL